MNERPVTGSCERCATQYALLIHVPGSGDLDVQRVAEQVAWCPGCARLVGRACCWSSAGVCVGCAPAHADIDASIVASAFAQLGAARASVRQLDAITAAFTHVEASVATTRTFATPDEALGAWHDAWLASCTLRIRLDGAREAAAGRLRFLPTTEPARARELAREFELILDSHEARWGTIAAAVADAGQRLAASGPPISRGTTSQPEPKARAAAAAIPRRVPYDVPASTPIAIAIEARPPAVALPIRPVVSPQLRVAVGAASRVRQAHATVQPGSRGPGSVSGTSQGMTVAASVKTATAIPAADGDRGRARRRQAERRGLRIGVAAMVAVAALAVVGAAGVALVAGWLDGAAPESAGRAVAPTAVTSHRDDPTGGSLPGATVLEPPNAATSMTFDTDRIGPLEVASGGPTRIIGAPEVVAYPSPFDRSARLLGTRTGFCVQAARGAGRGSSVLAFDLFLGQPPARGSLAVRLVGDGSAGHGYSLDLADLGAGPDDEWFRIRAAEQDGFSVEGRDADGPPSVIALQTDEDAVPASPDEACVVARLTTPQASVFIDNVRADR